MRAHLAAFVQHLIINTWQRMIVGDDLIQPAVLPCLSVVELCGHRLILGVAPEIESGWIFSRRFDRRNGDKTSGVTIILETRAQPRLRLIESDRKGFQTTTMWMSDMINAAAQRTPAPGVNDIK